MSRKRTQEQSPDVLSSDVRLPGGRVLLWVGIAVFLLSMVAGLVRSFRTNRWLPPVGVEYETELNQIVQERGRVAALPEIRSAARIDFDNEKAVTRLLQGAREAGDDDETVRALVALTRLRPEDGQVRSELVSALLEQGRFAEAHAQARFAVWLTPRSSEAYCNLGAALLGLGQKPQAAAVYRAALELDPGSEKARFALQVPLRGF